MLAARIIGAGDDGLRARVDELLAAQREKVAEMDARVSGEPPTGG